MPALSTGDLARATGTKVETIRYYERIGLLPSPARSVGGQRVYTPDHLRRLAFVRRSRDLGFGLDQARALLDFAHQPDSDCTVVDALARVHLVEVDRKLAELTTLRQELADLLDRCRRGRVADCRVIGALQPNQPLSGT